MRTIAVSSLLLTLTLAGCGSSAGDPFALCGNRQIDAGEECDDGPQNPNVADNDSCLGTCRLARCGDGFVDATSEQCDGSNLRSCGSSRTSECTCGDLGFAPGTLICGSHCSFDTSTCGVALTPTPVRSSTPSPSTTPSPSPTPASRCGNGVLESGETCARCPDDCVVSPCTVGTPLKRIRIRLALPPGATPSTITTLVGYRSSLVSLPANSRSRVKNTPDALVTVTDLDYAVRIALSTFDPPTSGSLFSIDFDTCNGAAATTVDDFGCTIEACGGVGDCGCTIEIP